MLPGARALPTILAAASLVGLTGCGSSNNPAPTPSGGSNLAGTMSATIDGVAWVANGRLTAQYSPAQVNVGASSLDLTGQDAGLTYTLGIGIASGTVGTPLVAGTYQVGVTATNASLAVGAGQTILFSRLGLGSGTVTLSTFNTTTRTASGTFSFVMLTSPGGTARSVTNGSFNVTF